MIQNQKIINMKTNLSLIAATILLSACAGVSLTPDGEKVRVLGPNEVGSCRELGKTNTSVTATVAGIEISRGSKGSPNVCSNQPARGWNASANAIM